MSQRLSRIVNVNVSVKEMNGKVVFLRKLAPGGSNHSFGIHVARLAGMPRTLVLRAEDVLESLESARSGEGVTAQNDHSPSRSPRFVRDCPRGGGHANELLPTGRPCPRIHSGPIDGSGHRPLDTCAGLDEIARNQSNPFRQEKLCRTTVQSRVAVNKSRGFHGMPRSTANSSCVSVPLNMYTPVAIKLRSLMEGTSHRRPPTPKATGRRGCSSPCWPSETRGRGCWARSNG